MVYPATSIVSETVNIGISKKRLPIWQVVSILDQKRDDQREASLMKN